MPIFEAGMAVAVLPRESSTPTDAMCIASVRSVDPQFVQLIDGRLYTAAEGLSISDQGRTYIVPATKLHMDTVDQRCMRNGASNNHILHNADSHGKIQSEHKTNPACERKARTHRHGEAKTLRPPHQRGSIP